MAEHDGKHWYTVTEGTYSRSNRDGSITTFMKGETVELEFPDTKARNLVPTPERGRAPSPAGFVPGRSGHEVTSTTVAQAAAARIKDTPRESDRTFTSEPVSRPAKADSVKAGSKPTTPVEIKGVDTGKE